MDEFELIRRIVAVLGEHAAGGWVSHGPGDDAAVGSLPDGHEWVASIDTLINGVHFPEAAPPALIGYRAMMVALSDLAAMAAQPGYVLIALNLGQGDAEWAVALADGIAQAAAQTQVVVAGGNLARGSRAISISVHGSVPAGAAVLRSGASPGDGIWVSGVLGGSAACVREQHFDVSSGVPLSPDQQAYYQPSARFDLMTDLRQHATAALDLSDGLLSDLDHLLQASGCGAQLCSADIPLHPCALLNDALSGGDDYEILCTSKMVMPGMTRIGEIVTQPGIVLDDTKLTEQQVRQGGYNHFRH